jgi:hypothetical protein
MIFLCNGGIDEEEKGSISRYWKENEEDVTASMDTLMTRATRTSTDAKKF